MGDSHFHDVSDFSKLASDQRNKAAIVFLDSPGGYLWTGIKIGQIIHRHGFSTVVADGVQCSSSCALAWLGGKERFIGDTAMVGFHAASHTTGEISPEGNAFVGAYLYEIGITEAKAIAYLTKASPHSMVWLTRSEAGVRNIPVEPIPFVKAPWAKLAPLSRLPRNDPVAEVGTMDSAATAANRGARQSATAGMPTTATTVGTTGHIIRVPVVSSPSIWEIVPDSLPAAGPTTPPAPQHRCRRFESPIPPDKEVPDEICPMQTTQE